MIHLLWEFTSPIIISALVSGLLIYKGIKPNIYFLVSVFLGYGLAVGVVINAGGMRLSKQQDLIVDFGPMALIIFLGLFFFIWERHGKDQNI